jgi:hypothetical protein
MLPYRIIVIDGDSRSIEVVAFARSPSIGDTLAVGERRVTVRSVVSDREFAGTIFAAPAV